MSLGACVLFGCTRPNPGFGDDNGGTGTGTGTSDTTPTATTAGADASVGSSTTKPTSTSSADDDATSAASHTSETLDGSESDDDTADTGPRDDLGEGRCGDGVLDSDEQCELGVNLEQTCESLEYGPGFLECTKQCKVEPHCCGDGDVDGNEACEPGELVDCPPYAIGENVQVMCTDDCHLPEQGCPACGDGIVQRGVEDCEFAGTVTCASLDFDGGQNLVACQECLYSTKECCIPDDAPCSVGEGIACCAGNCKDGICGID